MAPVVHGLEREYAGRVDFLFLHIADPKNSAAKERYGFNATPHFFFVRADGTPVESMQGVVSADSVRRALNRLVAESPLGKRR